MMADMLDLDALDFTKGGGLVTVVAQDARTGVILMLAHADREALEQTIRTGEMHYHSRTRGLWRKGATSGNVQMVVSLTADCDSDAILARVTSEGPACHAGSRSCFGDTALNAEPIGEVDAIIAERMAAGDAGKSYTRRLLDDRNLRLKKIGEEAAELVTACADTDADRAAEETADLLYHALVALRAAGGSLADVQRVLVKRHAAQEPRSR
jgi:phosphoribosyl-AMP cyclohydrolase / phosphoribosyl-ATP pyrophosphohydrolase